MRTFIFACFFLLATSNIFAQNTTKQAILTPSNSGTVTAPNGGATNDTDNNGGANQNIDDNIDDNIPDSDIDFPEIDFPNTFNDPDIEKMRQEMAQMRSTMQKDMKMEMGKARQEMDKARQEMEKMRQEMEQNRLNPNN